MGAVLSIRGISRRGFMSLQAEGFSVLTDLLLLTILNHICFSRLSLSRYIARNPPAIRRQMVKNIPGTEHRLDQTTSWVASCSSFFI